MDIQIASPALPAGQQEARTRWGTHESGAAFDRKKLPYLSQQAQEFLAQQAYCVIAGLGPHNELDGQLVMSKPGFIKVLDRQTCLLQLDGQIETSLLFQGLQQAAAVDLFDQLGLFFISHATRERLCIQGEAELLSQPTLLLYWLFKHKPVSIRLHVQQAFFHCPKYVRTRVPGLTTDAILPDHPNWQPQHLLKLNGNTSLAEEMRNFLAQQIHCFLCTVSQHGHCAVNHRGGAPGFLVTLPPNNIVPGGTILLPDYTGNGAFEALGNILETGTATLVVPNYATHIALCISGKACIYELHELPDRLLRSCPGAERVVALSVEHISVQHGNWSATLAYERGRAEYFSLMSDPTLTCPI
jgi:hypothetical protein